MGDGMNSYVQVWKRAFDFSGRSRRREFWMFTLINIVIGIVLSVLDSLLGLNGFATSAVAGASVTFFAPGLLSSIYNVLVLLPSIAVGIRRLHDTDRSGFWWFIALVPIVGYLVLIVFWASAGTPGHNRFGADPKSEQAVRA
jgi:uncharacterized membrane protein YhaH (DUF805 family)